MAHDEIQFIKALQAKGLRITTQRMLVLDAICDGKAHSTLAEIVARVKAWDASVDLSTIYRTLNLLCKLGFVTATEISGDKRYEIAQMPSHHHLVCQKCGEMWQIHHDDLVPLVNAVQARYGFQMYLNHLVFDGLCARCQDVAGHPSSAD